MVYYLCLILAVSCDCIQKFAVIGRWFLDRVIPLNIDGIRISTFAACMFCGVLG